MKNCSRNSRARPVGSNAKDIICRALSPVVRNSQIADAERDAENGCNCVSNLWKNQPTVMLQGTTKRPMTDRHSDDLPVSGEDDYFLADINKLHLAHSDV